MKNLRVHYTIKWQDRLITVIVMLEYDDLLQIKKWEVPDGLEESSEEILEVLLQDEDFWHHVYSEAAHRQELQDTTPDIRGWW